jgi:hypothetical protein
MTDRPTFEGFVLGLFTLGHLMQPALVLIAAARLDYALEVALLSRMRPLSHGQSKRLFEGYGPLATFSAKIDLGYALSIFDEKLYSDL